MKRRRSRMTKLHGVLIGIGVIGLIVLLYYGGRWLELRASKPEVRSDHTLRYEYEPTIEVNGVTYHRRTHLTTILLMGVDKESGAATHGFRNGGQADFLRLLVIDGKQKVITQVQLDRDTMTPIAILGVLGDRTSTRVAQLGLAHGFGDGKAQSCELAVEAVENLLLGTNIDFYMALNMDGISVLNDWAGGVTITLDEDFSASDPLMTKGATLTLQGEQAEIYVRGRMTVGDGTNESRMKRQQNYISLLLAQIERKAGEDQNVMGLLFDELAGHLQTDMARGRLINEFWAAKDYIRQPLIVPEGTHSIGSDGFMQFEIDEEKLEKLVLDLFYEPVNQK